MFLCKVFIFFQIITFLESKFEEAGWTANSSKKSPKNLPKTPSNRPKIVVWGWFWVAWERLAGGLGASWGVLGRPGGVLERLGAILGSSWGVLRSSWGRLGASWGRLGGILGRLGSVLGEI